MKTLLGKRIFLIFAALCFGILAGCASSNQTRYLDTSPRYPANEANIHPAAFVVDRFPVSHKTPSRDTSPIPFYFQKCTREIGNFISTRTQYDCD